MSRVMRLICRYKHGALHNALLHNVSSWDSMLRAVIVALLHVCVVQYAIRRPPCYMCCAAPSDRQGGRRLRALRKVRLRRRRVAVLVRRRGDRKVERHRQVSAGRLEHAAELLLARPKVGAAAARSTDRLRVERHAVICSSAMARESDRNEAACGSRGTRPRRFEKRCACRKGTRNHEEATSRRGLGEVSANVSPPAAPALGGADAVPIAHIRDLACSSKSSAIANSRC